MPQNIYSKNNNSCNILVSMYKICKIHKKLNKVFHENHDETTIP